MHKLLTGSLSVETVTVAIANLPPALQNTRIVQLSDLHYDGQGLSEEMLQEAIDVTNEAEADLIVLTGDYVTHEPDPIHDLALRLKQLQSRQGVYAVLGNHDLHFPQSQAVVTTALENVGIQVLWNAIAYPFGSALPLVGLADFWSPEFAPSVLEQLDAETPRLVLSHNPDSAVRLKRWRVDLQLSGHTHGGQVVLPKLGVVPRWGKTARRHIPKVLWGFVPYLKDDCDHIIQHWEWAQGLHQVGANQLYVNRGLGTYFPGRLFCPPEVTVLTLVGQ
jgi:uncharacterized protein